MLISILNAYNSLCNAESTVDKKHSISREAVGGKRKLEKGIPAFQQRYFRSKLSVARCTATELKLDFVIFLIKLYRVHVISIHLFVLSV